MYALADGVQAFDLAERPDLLDPALARFRRLWPRHSIWAVADYLDERRPNAACGIDIQVGPQHRGQGIAGLAVDTLLRSTERAGLAELVVPVRPPDKASEPFASMDEYARRVRSDGWPVDRWLRVHVRAGGRIDRVAPYAMTVTAGLDQWRRWAAWLGCPSSRSGTTRVACYLGAGFVRVPAEQEQEWNQNQPRPYLWMTYRASAE